ncbi:hypothetical protein SH449x_005003 [Pirellulaceae bacterium SH449]
MKKTINNRLAIFCATMVMAFSGCSCGQGWRPNILPNLFNRFHGPSNVGAPCDAQCVPPPACASCGDGYTSQYGGIDGEVISNYPSSYEIGAPVSYSAPQTYRNAPAPETVRSVPASR